MRPPLSPPHGAGLGSTTGITAVITLVAAVSVLGQCGNLAGVAAGLAACSLACFLLGAGGLYAARNWVGHALDLTPHDPAASGVAAGRGLTRFHLGMAGAFAGSGFASAFRLALPYGGLAWVAPAAAAVLTGVALAQAMAWASETRRRQKG